VLICVGHYAASGFDGPAKDKASGAPTARLLVELTDKAAWSTSRGKLADVLAAATPHPLRFRQVWSFQQGKQHLFAWQPVPPGPEFVAMGMVAGTSDSPPPVECVRCVPKNWLVQSAVVPRAVWDDSGSGGGRAGSLWSCNSLGLMFVGQGHTQPSEKFFDLKAEKFFMTAKDVPQN
jgi:hypothetical protein